MIPFISDWAVSVILAIVDTSSRDLHKQSRQTTRRVVVGATGYQHAIPSIILFFPSTSLFEGLVDELWLPEDVRE